MGNAVSRTVNMELTVDEYERLSDFIYRKAGIRFEARKIYFLSKRVKQRINELGMKDPSEYIRFLRFLDNDGAEIQNLLNLLTINETYFFRDFPQLQCFAEHALADVTEKKAAAGDMTLRIWSAACSSGEEPYTLAIILCEMLDDISEWDIEIIATDIDRNILGKARQAVYSDRSVKNVPAEYRKRYFDSGLTGSHKLRDEIKRFVRLEYLNLADRAGMRKMRGFDFIFCRNVLIYFDDVSRKQVVDHFYIALNHGGYIFLGSSESVGRINTAFKVKKAGGHLVYMKEQR